MTEKSKKKVSKIDKGAKRVAKPHYSIPPEDIDLIETLRSRYQSLALKKKSNVPADIAKSEIVRAGVHALKNLSDSQFYKAIESLQRLSKGRPEKK